MRAVVVVALLVLGLLALDMWRTSAERDSAQVGQVIRASRLLMGTIVQVKIWAMPALEDAARRAAFDALDLAGRLEGRISSWQETSETSAVNRAAGEQPVAVGEDLLDLVSTSIEWAQLTGGAFDVTGGPLYELWEATREGGAIPSENAIRERLKIVGHEQLVIAANSIHLKQPAMRLGFGAIGKGFIADRVAGHIRDQGFPNFIVDAGGDLVLGGTRGEDPWNIAVRHPREQALLATCHATDCAVATSGDYERFIEVDGVRYSHLLDPRTGWPVRGLVSVTVFAQSGADADALATALFVMGSEEGLALAESIDGIETLMIEEDGEVRLSSGLRLDGTELILAR